MICFHSFSRHGACDLNPPTLINPDIKRYPMPFLQLLIYLSNPFPIQNSNIFTSYFHYVDAILYDSQISFLEISRCVITLVEGKVSLSVAIYTLRGWLLEELQNQLSIGQHLLKGSQPTSGISLEPSKQNQRAL